MGSYITCVDLYPPNDMFWLKTDKRCPSCFEGSYICAQSFMYTTPSLNHFVSNRPSDFRGMLIKEDLKG